MGTTAVDAEALHAIAREYETVADMVDAAARDRLGALTFGPSTGGRAYVAHAAELRGALDGVVSALRQWSRAAAEVAAALRGSATGYDGADARAAGRLG
jgi:hypothetical protein